KFSSSGWCAKGDARWRRRASISCRPGRAWTLPDGPSATSSPTTEARRVSRRADQIRARRRAFALPGGSLDRTIRILAVALPALVGAVAATMLIAPLSPRGEVSFLLDRNKVATAEDRLRVDNAMYRGQDNRGRPFSLTAGEAVQSSERVPVVRLQDLTARLLLSEGPAVLTAPAGRYAIDEQRVIVDGIVRFAAADGYRMTARDVSID